jgi:hypothetical protein
MSDVISWDEAIGKKVKSSDGKDLGKVQSITRDYIQTKEGIVSKNYYYIPKFYLSGYDGDNLWVSLTKYEVKSRFEREKAPEPGELETSEYAARRAQVLGQHQDFASSIPAYRPLNSGVEVSWDKLIEKKVKSSDGKDLGDVESVSTNYIEVKEGVVNKKRYFIPKYYIQGFDGDNLWVSLTKDQIKERFEREIPPSPSEFQTEEYRKQMRKVETTHPQFARNVPWMAREPSTEIPVDYSGTTYSIPWNELIHKHVRASDNVEVGYIERIGEEFIVVRDGTSEDHIYYIPKTYIKDYDGAQLRIDVPSGLVRSRFERREEPSLEELRMLAREAPRVKRAEPAAQRTAEEPENVSVETDINLDKVGRTTESS